MMLQNIYRFLESSEDDIDISLILLMVLVVTAVFGSLIAVGVNAVLKNKKITSTDIEYDDDENVEITLMGFCDNFNPPEYFSIMLTSKHVIKARRKAFGKIEQENIPIADIKIKNTGILDIKVEHNKNSGIWNEETEEYNKIMEHVTVYFSKYSKNGKKARTNSISFYCSDADGVDNFVKMANRFAFSGDAVVAVDNEELTAGQCKYCGGPISGIIGSVVICPSCGMKTKLG